MSDSGNGHDYEDDGNWYSFGQEEWAKPDKRTEEKVLKALTFAKEKHQDQTTDNGVSYFKHIEDVMEILIEDGNGFEDSLVVAALHDVLNTTSTTFAEIEKEFGNETAREVKLLTKVKGEPYDTYLDRVFSNDEFLGARTIELADRVANLRDLPSCNNLIKIQKYLKETRKCFFTRIGAPDLLDEIRGLLISFERKFYRYEYCNECPHFNITFDFDTGSNWWLGDCRHENAMSGVYLNNVVGSTDNEILTNVKSPDWCPRKQER